MPIVSSRQRIQLIIIYHWQTNKDAQNTFHQVKKQTTFFGYDKNCTIAIMKTTMNTYCPFFSASHHSLSHRCFPISCPSVHVFLFLEKIEKPMREAWLSTFLYFSIKFERPYSWVIYHLWSSTNSTNIEVSLRDPFCYIFFTINFIQFLLKRVVFPKIYQSRFFQGLC